MRIAFVGIPSSGKSTTARELAKRLRGVYIPEVARILIESLKRKPREEDQDFIMRFQSTLERTMVGKDMISDVTIYLNHIYYRLYWGNTPNSKTLYNIAKKHKYDLIFKLSPLPYKQDGVRYQTVEEIRRIDQMIDDYQDDFGKYIYVEPTDLEERMRFILNEVRAYEAVSCTSTG